MACNSQLTKGNRTLSCEGVFSQGKKDPMNTEPLLVIFTNDHDSKHFKDLVKEERKSLNVISCYNSKRENH